MKKYLLKITPLEPFTFGGENGFAFSQIGKEGSYYMESGKTPEQTTLIGMVRYLILQSEGLLNADFSYTQEERQKMNAACGAATFTFEPEQVQDFGFIQEVSPLFLVDENRRIYIKNPFCNTQGESSAEKSSAKALQPMKMITGIDCSMGGKTAFPENDKTGYIAKSGYGSGYLCISDGVDEAERLKSDAHFFQSQMIAGNKKNTPEDGKQDGFFRREAITMKHASFGLYLSLADEAKELIGQSIVYMGKKKCAFRVEAERVDDERTLAGQAEAYFKSCSILDTWYYCLSDVLPDGYLEYQNFGIVESKLVRNLKTDYEKRGMTRKEQKRYHLIAAGSVFFEDIPECLKKDEKQLSQVGYNQIIRLGGN